MYTQARHAFSSHHHKSLKVCYRNVWSIQEKNKVIAEKGMWKDTGELGVLKTFCVHWNYWGQHGKVLDLESESPAVTKNLPKLKKSLKPLQASGPSSIHYRGCIVSSLKIFLWLLIIYHFAHFFLFFYFYIIYLARHHYYYTAPIYTKIFNLASPFILIIVLHYFKGFFII